MPGTPATPDPLALNTAETAVALYATGVPPVGASLPDLAADGVTRLGVDQVRALSQTWVGFNILLLYGLISLREYTAQMAVHWPDADRLQDCNTAAFYLKASSP
jgi:hypothetical protein